MNNDVNLIRTIFVTAFTGNVGYERRKDACPIWVSKAHPYEYQTRYTEGGM